MQDQQPPFSGDGDGNHHELVQLFRKKPYHEALNIYLASRIYTLGPQEAVRSPYDPLRWSESGAQQMDFLVDQGLTSDSLVLEVGCGTGRLATELVPRLNPGNYMGLDLCHTAVQAAMHALRDDMDRTPYFLWLRDGNFRGLSSLRPIHTVFAHDVVPMMPEEDVVELFNSVASLNFNQFLFTFIPSQSGGNQQKGLCRFAHDPIWLCRTAEDFGLDPNHVIDHRWSHGQATMKITRKEQADGPNETETAPGTDTPGPADTTRH